MGPTWQYTVAAERAYSTPYTSSPLLLPLLLSMSFQKHSPNTKSEIRNEYDYIVVGAGSAGSVVASRLSEIPCVSVLLLEAGKPPPRLTEIPGIAIHFVNTDLDWKYQTTPQKYTAAGLRDRRVFLGGGKTLGGSSTFNSMLYARGNRRNYDEWAALGAEGWSYNEVLPYFKKLEDNRDPEYLVNGYHGVGGPITASKPPYNPELKILAKMAVSEAGFQFVDPNAKEQIGFYDYQSSTRAGQRCSTAKAYLVPNEHRPNLDIVPNAMVRKVIIENKEAIGVEFDFEGSTRKVTAKKEVILSAGVINTAQILMLSGIGPMSELMKHDIPVIADLPVGFNLKDHPGYVLTYEVDNRILSFYDELRDENNIKEYISLKSGPLTACNGYQLVSFLSNPDTDNAEIPDHTVYIGNFERLFVPAGYSKGNKTIIICASQLLHPHSTGTVSLKSANPYEPPEIDPNYFSDFRDIKDIVEGLKVCNRIMGSPAMKSINTRPIDFIQPECEEFSTEEDMYLRCLVRTNITTAFNRVGTARMGDPRDPRTVVDPQLRVKGVSRLRVVDASIMPTVPWGNTNIPTIMVAEKASDIIKSTIQCAPEPTINWQPFSTFSQIQSTWTF